jgi:CubicO group peptidase (beta-lactamase class C family)
MYSNVGAALAAHAVAEARSEPFDVLTERTVFEPLGMQHSHWFLADFDDIDTVARPHQIGPEGLSVGEHYGFPTWPDGQLRAPARDLAQLLRVPLGQGTVDGHRLLSPEASQALHTVAIDGLDDWYIRPYISEQYLLWFGMDLDGRWLVGHDGDDDGVTSEMFYEPATGRGVVVLANVADGELDGRVREVTAWLQHTLFDLEVP